MSFPSSLLEAALNSLWQGSLLVLGVGLGLRLVPKLNASTRFLVWWATLVALVAFPVLGYFLKASAGSQTTRPRTAQLSAAFENDRTLNQEASEQKPAVTPGTTSASPQSVLIPIRPSPRGDLPPARLPRSVPGWQGVAAEPGFQIQVPLDGVWGLALGLWSLGVLVHLGRLSRGLRQLRFLKATSLDRGGSSAEWATPWMDRLGVRRRVRVQGSHAIATPLTAGLGRPVILLPAGLTRCLTKSELDQIVVHELAHVRRYDDWTLLLERAIAGLFFFHPAVWFLTRRLSREREMACDDWVVSVLGQPRSYARCLTHLWELNICPGKAALTPAAVGPTLPIIRRVEMLLNTKLNHTTRVSRIGTVLASTCLAMLFAALLLAPPWIAVAQEPVEPAASSQGTSAPDGSAISEEVSFGRSSWNWSDGLRKVSLQARGKMTLAGDLTRIEHLAPRSWLKLREREGLRFHSVTVRPDRDGEPTYRYYVYGMRREFDDEAQDWLAELLPSALENTGVAVASRVKRLLAEEGIDGVLRKISDAESDYVKALYFDALFENAPEIDALEPLIVAVQTIGSDHYRQSVLAQILDHSDNGRRLGAVFIETVEELRSDHYRQGVLRKLLDQEGLSDGMRARVAQAASGLDSGHYAAGLLTRLAEESLQPAARAAYLEAVGEMASAQYRQRALRALVKAYPKANDVLAGALRQTADLNSDHYRHELLHQIAPLVSGNDVLREPFFAAVVRFSSDHYHAQLLARVLDTHELDEPTVLAVLTSVRDLSGDHYKRQVLQQLLPSLPSRDETLKGFLTTVATLDSEHHLTQSLNAFLERPNLSEEILRHTLMLTKKHVHSDHLRRILIEKIADQAWAD